MTDNHSTIEPTLIKQYNKKMGSFVQKKNACLPCASKPKLSTVPVFTVLHNIRQNVLFSCRMLAAHLVSPGLNPVQ